MAAHAQRVSTVLIGVGMLMVCLATPAALVSAQAPAPVADGGSDQAVAPEEPAEAPAPPPPSAVTSDPSATPSAAPTTPAEETEPTPPAPLPVADSSTPVSAAGSASVAILDGSTQSSFRFSPSSITVGAGDTVTWTNNGSEPHDVTGSGLASGTLQSGQGYSHTFASPGTFSYICSIHPFMKGSVTVQAAEGSGQGTVGDPGATQDPSDSTAPGSESAAVTSPEAAGSAAQLPSSGMPVLPPLAAGVALLLTGALLRRRARVS